MRVKVGDEMVSFFASDLLFCITAERDCTTDPLLQCVRNMNFIRSAKRQLFMRLEVNVQSLMNHFVWPCTVL